MENAKKINQEIVKKLYEISELLELQKANHFRVNAYKRAANTIEQLDKSVVEIIDNQGITGLTALPSIGEGIARLLYEYVATGKVAKLEMLKGENDPTIMLTKIPGIGNKLATKIYESLHIGSLEELELSLHDGRLQQVPGIGPMRLKTIRLWLENSFAGHKSQPYKPSLEVKPSLVQLLDVDQEYRHAASNNTLPKIKPRRFNQKNEAWLPILHANKHGWHFTALYSNTHLAHKLGKTLDWVIIYYYDNHHRGGQCTVVTENKGILKGRRVVRGRELEAQAYYSQNLAS